MRLNLPRSKVRRAFTLIEMMVVVVIIGIISAMIIPEMKGSFDDALLRSTGRDLTGVFDLASSRAVGFNQHYRVKFDLQNGRYVLERQVHTGTREDFVPLKDVSGAEGRVDSRLTVEIGPADGGSTENDAGGGQDSQPLTDAISFYPDGTADAAVVRVRDRAGFQLLLQLNPITARVHITEAQPE
jgi:prepilin-type N-terminal cleavage/methylation domain-containing protein